MWSEIIKPMTMCVICEVSLQNWKGYIGVVYRSPSQNSAEFKNFLSDFDELLSKTASTKSLVTIILGDVNAILGNSLSNHPIFFDVDTLSS